MTYTHLFIGLGITAWVISVEYRLWANLRILGEALKVDRKREPSHLHTVQK